MHAATDNDELSTAGVGQRSAAAWTLLLALHERGITVRREGAQLLVSEADLASIPREELAALRHLRQEALDLLLPVAAIACAPALLGSRLPLSSSQRRMWDIENVHGFQAPRLTSALIVRGVMDADRLEQAFASVVTRHSALRIQIEDVAGEPMQVVRDDVAFRLDRVDVRGDSPADCWASADQVRSEYFARPMALASGEVIRAALVRVEEDTSCLLICVHHICADGRSMQILRKDLVAFYLTQPSEALSGSGVAQFAEYVQWEHARLARDQAGLAEFWSRAVNSDYCWRELRDGSVRSGTPGAAKLECRLAPGHVLQLKSLARKASATLNAVMLAVVAVVMDRHCVSLNSGAQRGINIGMPVTGRAIARFEDVIGFFANTIIVSIDSEKMDAGFLELVRHCQQRLGDAMLHQALPFQDILQAMKPAEGTRPFQVSFNMVAADVSATATLPGMHIAPWEGEPAAGFFDLRIDVVETADGVIVQLVHLLEKLSSVYVERLIREILAIVGMACVEAG